MGREGLPSVLASLRLLGLRDEELSELLLTQGLLSTSELGHAFFTRLFEQWSLHNFEHAEAFDHATELASNGSALSDVRDSLNLLAGLWRCGIQAADLEERLLSLAYLGPGEREIELVGRLLDASELHAVVPRYDAVQTLQLFCAACMLSTSCKEGSSLEARLAQTVPWERLSQQVARLSRQLSLIERRQLLAAARVAEDLDRRHKVSLKLDSSMEHLPVVALPPLSPFLDRQSASKAPSRSPAPTSLGAGTYEAVWLLSSGRKGKNNCVRYLGPRDIFIDSSRSAEITPNCNLIARALVSDGWNLTLTA